MMLLVLVLVLLEAAASAETDAKDMRIVGRSDLLGHGNGGEGLALREYESGQRVLFLAHESAPICFSVIDVTDVRSPKVLTQVPTVRADVRCNSLGLSGDVLAVAHQTARVGLPHAGVRVYDVSTPESPEELSFFDTSGPHSRGAHFVWFVDGEYAYVATGGRDFVPTHSNDDQFLMIVDLRDPRRPREIGRWWLPGTREGDSEPPLPRRPIDGGYRLHSPYVSPERPDRVYAGWIDGGVVILDIADRSQPKLVSRHSWYPPEIGYTHTAFPLFGRDLLVAAEEAVRDRCEDWPKRIWMVDITDEQKPRRGAVLPTPPNREDLCKSGGRFGAHNVHVNRPGAFSKTLTETVIGTFFSGGVRIYSITDPADPREIAFLVPEAPPGNRTGAIQLNDVYVDEKGWIYTNDRDTGGLY
ncbi:MAG TPA: hypothetical protein VJ921_05830, partial [Vicinamibacteria bacterium]|nr:hypothetical protein [Vicinamibacteria bacterium]